MVISFNSVERMSKVIVDFKGDSSSVHSVNDKNGNPLEYEFENEHIIVKTPTDDNCYQIEFTPTRKSINRRDDFLYTLLVPDRARLLFPLFDQPDIKARYTLTLKTKASWSSVSNGAIESETLSEDSLFKSTKFGKSDPISSYLFAFASGEFEVVEKSHNGRVHKIYHRENDPQKLEQFDNIFVEMFHSLDWLEDYTATPYPFAKYDLVFIPGFQYGGMEHVGATFYNSSIMFLGATPTINQRLDRAKLIAHETAHMWFGDYVTMRWFDDVWTKEVFANYFAAKIIAPLFPSISGDKSMVSYFPAAMGEDRTNGAQPIKQQLDNLQYAGLIYNSIIYNKTPIVFSMITEMMGEDAFRESIREYMRSFGYSSATWEELVAIFDKHSQQNIKEWSAAWINNSGIPHYYTKIKGNKLTINQKDPKKNDVLRSQHINFDIIGKSGEKSQIKQNIKNETTAIELETTPKAIIPNCDAMAYGYFKLDSATIEYVFENFSKIEQVAARRSLLITLNENMLNGNIKGDRFVEKMLPYLETEKEAIVFSALLSYISGAATLYSKLESTPIEVEKALWTIYDNPQNDNSQRYSALTTVAGMLYSEQSRERVYSIWESEKCEVKLAERDYTSFSESLAIAYKERAEQIIEKQLARIKNADSRAEYQFVSQAINPSTEKRLAFFNSLLDVKNRGVESWVNKSLRLLTHRSYSESEKSRYIASGLAVLPEIQRTGDIFFPQNWTTSLLAGCKSGICGDEVRKFIEQNPNLHPLLLSKLQIAAHHLKIN